MGARILDHYRGCGSLDVYLLIDGHGWVIVEGVELDEREALDALHRVAGERHYVESDAFAAFDARKEPATGGTEADP